MFSERLHDFSIAVGTCSYTTHQTILGEQEALEMMCRQLEEVKARKGIVYIIGNGGSAGIASHISADLIKTLKIPSQTLYDSNLFSCIANDLGYENVFSDPLSKLMTENDLLIAISSSGRSPNILKAAEMAILRRAPVITLSGFLANNPLRQLGHLNIWIDRADYGLVETGHFFILHTVVDVLNKVFPGKKENACAVC